MRNGKEILLFTNDAVFKDHSAENILSSYLTGSFGLLKSVQQVKNTFCFKNKKILLIDSTGVYPKNVKPDLLILTQTPKINLDRLLLDLKPKIIVSDASNSYSIQKNWNLSCIKRKIPFHATSEKGFYKLN